MPAGLKVTRLDHTALELRSRAAKSRDAGQVRRLLALAMILEGVSRGSAAAQNGMDRQTLRDWVIRYNALGIAGLLSRHGGGRKAVLSGGAGADTLSAGGGDDRVTGEAGNDILDGGAGIDAVIYSGRISDYTVTDNGDGSTTVVDNRVGSPNGTDTIRGFENLSFNSAATGLVTISGTPVVGEVLTVSNTLADPDGLGPISYQWQADDIDIGGATGATLLLAVAQLGHAITVVASYVDLLGAAESIESSPTGLITADLTAPTVTAVTATPADAVIGYGAVAGLRLVLSEAVTVDTDGGVPTLSLGNGAVATYQSGSGSSTLVFSYTVSGGQDTADLTVGAVNLNGAVIADLSGNAADLGGAVVNPAGILKIEAIAAFDVTTGQAIGVVGSVYSGPVVGIEQQFIAITADNLNVTAATNNWFIRTGGGNDAIAVSSGTNVLDGGTGSNFMTGGSGTDTFFVDTRGATAATWNTIVNFQTGDTATIWGATPDVVVFSFVDSAGAAGFTGLTLHATAANMPTASMTFAGMSIADLTSGHLTQVSGFDPVSGSTYTSFQVNA